GRDALPVARDVQARALSWTEVEAYLVAVVHHHPVGTEVDVAEIRIARHHHVGRPDVAPTVERPVPRRSEGPEVDVGALQDVVVDGRRLPENCDRWYPVLELGAELLDHLPCAKVGIDAKRECDSRP